ncbi:LuxR C-terminal-related transcriptional regulator [Chryseobacterium fistulae]
MFKLLAIGNGNLEIANILNIQVSTVGTYKKESSIN